MTSVIEMTYSSPEELQSQDNAVLETNLDLEKKFCSPKVFHVFGGSNNFLVAHTEINAKKRSKLVEWMFDIPHVEPKTMFIAVNILDRFLAKKQVPISKFQVVGCASLLLASKLEELERKKITSKTLIWRDDSHNLFGNYPFDLNTLLQVETIIANTLNFDLHFPTAYDFIDREIHENELAMTSVLHIMKTFVIAGGQIPWGYPSEMAKLAVDIIKQYKNADTLD
jgi:hypothetical protein